MVTLKLNNKESSPAKVPSVKSFQRLFSRRSDFNKSAVQNDELVPCDKEEDIDISNEFIIFIPLHLLCSY